MTTGTNAFNICTNDNDKYTYTTFAHANVMLEKRPTGTHTFIHSFIVILGSVISTIFPWTSIALATHANAVPHDDTNIGFPKPASLIKCLFDTTVMVLKIKYPRVYIKAGTRFVVEYFDSSVFVVVFVVVFALLFVLLLLLVSSSSSSSSSSRE